MESAGRMDWPELSASQRLAFLRAARGSRPPAPLANLNGPPPASRRVNQGAPTRANKCRRRRRRGAIIDWPGRRRAQQSRISAGPRARARPRAHTNKLNGQLGEQPARSAAPKGRPPERAINARVTQAHLRVCQVTCGASTRRRALLKVARWRASATGSLIAPLAPDRAGLESPAAS